MATLSKSLAPVVYKNRISVFGFFFFYHYVSDRPEEAPHGAGQKETKPHVMLHAAAGNDSEMPPARRQKSVFWQLIGTQWQAALSLRWTSHRWLGHGAPERLLLIVEFLCSSTSGLTFSHVTQHRGREAGILWTGRQSALFYLRKSKEEKHFFQILLYNLNCCLVKD